MPFILALLLGIGFLLAGPIVKSPPTLSAENQNAPPAYQYFDGSYYYYGNYSWKGTWYPSGWYLSPGNPAPPGYVSQSGWPTKERSSTPDILPPLSQGGQEFPSEGQGPLKSQGREPPYTYFDGRYYFYQRYYWNGEWYPTGWYASLGVPAPAGYLSPTGWRPGGKEVPPFDYYDGAYYYYNPYFWNGITYPAGWYVGLGIAAPIGYISPTGWYFGIALPLPVPLFFDGFFYYYSRYFWGGRWFGAGWYARPGRPGPVRYVSPTGWRPGKDPSRFRPVRDFRQRPSLPGRVAPKTSRFPVRPSETIRRPVRSLHGGGGRSDRHPRRRSP